MADLVSKIRIMYDIKEARSKFTDYYELFNLLKSKLTKEYGIAEFERKIESHEDNQNIYESLNRAKSVGRPNEVSDWTSVEIYKFQKQKYQELLKIHDKVELANTLVLTILGKFDELFQVEKKMILDKHQIKEQIDLLRCLTKKFFVKTEGEMVGESERESANLISRIHELNKNRLHRIIKTLKDKLFEINEKMKNNEILEPIQPMIDQESLDNYYEVMGREFKEILFLMRKELNNYNDQTEKEANKLFFDNLEKSLDPKIIDELDFINEKNRDKSRDLVLCILYKYLEKKKIELRLVHEPSPADQKLHEMCLKLLTGGDLFRKSYVAHVESQSGENINKKLQISLSTFFERKEIRGNKKLFEIQKKNIIIYHQEGSKYFFDIFVDNRFYKISNLEFLNKNLPNDNTAFKIVKITHESILNSIKLVKKDLFSGGGDKDYRRKSGEPELNEEHDNFKYYKRGDIPYEIPVNWIRFGLNVSKLYGNDIDWLSVHNKDWSVGFLVLNHLSVWKTLESNESDELRRSSELHAKKISGLRMSSEILERKSTSYSDIQEEKVPEALKDYPGGVILLKKINDKVTQEATGKGVEIGKTTFKLAFQCKARVKKQWGTCHLVAEKASDIRPYGILILKSKKE